MNINQAALNVAISHLRLSGAGVRLLIAQVREEAAILGRLEDKNAAAIAETLRTFASDLERAFTNFDENLSALEKR
jgi:hypothetical protein